MKNQLSDQSPITVVIGGDFCPTLEVEREFLSGHKDSQWLIGEAADIFQRSDIGIVNLECVLSSHAIPIMKIGPCLKVRPDTIRLLSDLRIGLVTTANNHIRDFGDKGVCETLETCSAHDIHTVGAGATLKAARQIYYYSVRGRRLGIINVTEKAFSHATETRAGANHLDIIDLLADIGEARHNADHLLLIVHGGLEYSHYPSPQSVKLLRFLAEQGLTAVIRHHPHFVQGYEVWKGVPIFYSLGNFLFPTTSKNLSGWFEGMVVELQIAADNACSFNIHGVEQCLNGPRLHILDGEEKVAFLARVEEYSQAVKDQIALEREWQKLVLANRESYYGLLILPNHFLMRVLRRLKLLKYIRPTTKKHLLYEDFFQCEAHREALTALFTKDRRD